MICSSVKRFFTSNLLRMGDWTPNRRATQNRGDVALEVLLNVGVTICEAYLARLPPNQRLRLTSWEAIPVRCVGQLQSRLTSAPASRVPDAWGRAGSRTDVVVCVCFINDALVCGARRGGRSRHV